MKMKAVKLVENVYWVGAVDWNLRNFHGHTFRTKRGTTYNAYLIMDEKVTLVDTVYAPFSGEMLERIREIVPPEKIDYIIANHVEPDHSGSLPRVLELCPKAKVFGTAKCREELYRYYYADWDFTTVKTGDTLKLGARTLKFLEAPMLHWPDSMFSYLAEDELLLPNDAFGQHYATSERFADEVDQGALMDEAAAYYANILWPFSTLVVRKIEEVQKLNIPIKMIAPSHGLIWRKDPMNIVNSYMSWGRNETKPKAVIVYETMWRSTEKMAKKLAEGLTDAGVSVKLFDVNENERTEIIKEMLDARGYLIGSATHDNGMLPGMAGFLWMLKGMKPKNRLACAFGSFGWGGGATAGIEGMLKEAGVEKAAEALSFKFLPDEKEMKLCCDYGREFGAKLLK